MNRLIYEPAIGRTIEEMRENFEKGDLYNRGDAKLIWVNEGDLSMMDILESLHSGGITDSSFNFTQEELESMYEE